MEFTIPSSYKLTLNDFNDVITYNYDNKIIKIDNNINLYLKNNIIYKFNSTFPLENLLDLFHIKDNIGIKKIYYFLISKFLLSKAFTINKIKWFASNYSDKLLLSRQYLIINNDCIISTAPIQFNFCIIINNNTINKTFICIIDSNCYLNCLYDIIENNNLFLNKRYEDIKITIIGGSIDTIDRLIEIYLILKRLKLSKFISQTFILKSKPIKSINYNSFIKKIKFSKSFNFTDNDLNNYYSDLHKII